MLTAIAQYNDPIGAILFWFGLFVVLCLFLGAWGWGKAIRMLHSQQKDQQKRQNMRDEIDARTLRRLREEQGWGLRGEAQTQPSRQPLPRWNETTDQYESRRREQRKERIAGFEGPEVGNLELHNETVGRARSRPAIGEGFSEQTQHRYCTKCGTQARAGDRFCAACGDELASG